MLIEQCIGLKTGLNTEYITQGEVSIILTNIIGALKEEFKALYVSFDTPQKNFDNTLNDQIANKNKIFTASNSMKQNVLV